MDEKAGPDQDAAYRALIRATAELAANCAMALAEQGMFTQSRSTESEQAFRRMAEAVRSGGGQVAETVFERRAEDIARLRRRSGDPTP